MLSLSKYNIEKMFNIFNTHNRQELQRKLDRYGVEYSVSGRGTRTEYEIQDIFDEFKLYCILDLGMSANTDFRKFAYFLYYFLNDDDFCWLPDETLERRMDENGSHISRQTITNYKRKLENLEFIHNSREYVYYFAKGQDQKITTREKYSKAWREYWENKDSDKDSYEAICIMCANYGGVARKQPIMEYNAIYLNEINKLNDLVCDIVENNLYPLKS